MYYYTGCKVYNPLHSPIIKDQNYAQHNGLLQKLQGAQSSLRS
jgi:hypothetical protein